MVKKQVLMVAWDCGWNCQPPEEKAGPASAPLGDQEEFEKFISDKDASGVDFFKDLFSESHSELPKATSNLRDN